MSAIPSDHLPSSEEDLLAEYRFDYRKAKPNRFAVSHETTKLRVVVLDEDVAQVFTTPESVNKALRALIESMPHQSAVLDSNE